MRPNVSRKLAIRATIGIAAILLLGGTLVLFEQRRTEPELDAALSAYLSDGILHDAHDWGSGKGILIVLQREAQQPGNWRFRWLFPFDKRFRFAGASFTTRCSFVLSNALGGDHRLALHLPSGVTLASASRRDLEGADSSGEFQKRFPNNLGYVAVSRAGLNFGKTEAIFYLDHFCGLCGGGRYVLMRKVAGVWRVADEGYTWVS
jgi:hypothetical protein